MNRGKGRGKPIRFGTKEQERNKERARNQQTDDKYRNGTAVAGDKDQSHNNRMDGDAAGRARHAGRYAALYWFDILGRKWTKP